MAKNGQDSSCRTHCVILISVASWRRGFYFFDILLYSYMLNCGRKKIDISRWPLELPANQYSRFGRPELDWAELACAGWLGNSKGHCRMSFFFLSPLLAIRVDQNIKKLETFSSWGIWNWCQRRSPVTMLLEIKGWSEPVNMKFKFHI